jgi:AcrR family transcriptional regulator
VTAITNTALVERRRRERAAALAPIARTRRTHEERSAETQSALVEAAIAMLCELGYAGVTTAEVARRAGCTTGAMHHHFGSKDELMLAVLARLTLEFEARYATLKDTVWLTLEQRCDRVVRLLADYYMDPRYVAIWELYVGTRCEPELNGVCVQNRTRVISELESVWIHVFAGVKAKRPEVVALMRFTLTFLRSLGLNQTLGTDPGASAGQLSILRATLLDRLMASVPPKRAASRE